MARKIPLRNDHTVMILGAGYSARRGLPLIGNFLNRMRDALVWCERNGRSREALAIEEVLRFRLDAASAAYRVPIDLENIEELFSLASAADPHISRSVRLSIAATLNYCQTTSPEAELLYGAGTGLDGLDGYSLQMGVDPRSRVIPLYDALAIKVLGVTSPTRTSILTFNYDDLIERSVRKVHGTVDYGFSARFEAEDGSWLSREGVPVLKLHGSVNWAYPGARGKKFTVFNDYESIYSRGLSPELVPPTWNKTFADRLAEVWFSAIDKLSTATRIVVIGFSIPRTDLHFKYLLAAGMKQNLSLREVVFIDPFTGMEDRVAEVLAERERRAGRVRVISKKVESLLGAETALPNRLSGSFAGLPY